MGPKPVLSPLVELFLDVLCILSFTVKPSPHRWLFFLLIASTVIYCALFTRVSLGDEAWEMGQANILMIKLFDASVNILLTEPQRDLRHIGDDNNLDISKASFGSRLRWGVTLWASPRGVNFTHEPTAHIPPRPKQRTRWAFVLEQLRSIALHLILVDLTGIMNRANPYWTKDLPLVNGNQRLWRLASFGYALVIYSTVTIKHKLLSILSVLAGLSEPRDWPDFFGSLLDAYTVGRVWGKVWHQMFRRTVLVHADFFIKKLHLPLYSKSTKLIKLYIAFLVSGLLHYGGDAFLLQDPTKTGAIQFFLLQATAITFETMVFALARKAGLPGLAHCIYIRWLGYLWVVVWLAFSMPVWIDPLYRYGFTEAIPTFSPIVWLWRRVFGYLKCHWDSVNLTTGAE